MTALEWQPSEELPESHGRFVDLWLSLSGGIIIPGQFLEDTDQADPLESIMWFDEDRYLIDPATVQYWLPRIPGEPIPEPPC